MTEYEPSDQERIDRYAEAIGDSRVTWILSSLLSGDELATAAHAAVAVADAELDALKAENAMLRACRETEQNALATSLPIVAAATDGPRLWVEPDAYGEPTIWTDDEGGIPQPVLAKSDLCVGSRHLWPVVVARLTAGSAS